MDQTTRPLLIPPQFALYAEKHSIFELYQVKFALAIFFSQETFNLNSNYFKRLLSQLIIYKPDDPLQYLIDFLRKDVDCKLNLLLLFVNKIQKF